MNENNLPERKFIHEEYPKNPFPFWLWLFLGAVAACLLWGGYSWYSKFMNTQVEKSSSIQVSNRDFSIFLWQFPEYMRVNTPNKTAYLPGFQYQEKVSLDLGYSEAAVIAPPEIIFLYHTWKRLLSPDFIERPISASEFQEFLNYAEEWKPINWPGAPKEYVKFMESFPTTVNVEDLRRLSLKTFPLEVRQAFIGWKNFFKEGDAINEVSLTYQELEQFLAQAPRYARNYWRTIVMKGTPHYLEGFRKEDTDRKAKVPPDQLTSFFKTAFYNYRQALKNK